MKTTGKKRRWFGWHFLMAPGVMRGGAPAKLKGVERIGGALIICYRGLHASKSINDALKYNPGGFTLRRVELLGKRQDEDDKSAALRRRVLFTIPAEAVEKALQDWMIWCAYECLKENPGVDDDLLLYNLLRLEMLKEETTDPFASWGWDDDQFFDVRRVEETKHGSLVVRLSNYRRVLARLMSNFDFRDINAIRRKALRNLEKRLMALAPKQKGAKR